DHVETQKRQEGVIGASGGGADGFSVAAIGATEVRKPVRHAVSPFVASVGNDHRPTDGGDGERGVQPTQEIDDIIERGSLAQKVGGVMERISFERVEHGKRADGEAGVIEIAVAVASGPTAVGALFMKHS